MQEYKEAEDKAKKGHVGIWQFGDATPDDDNL